MTRLKEPRGGFELETDQQKVYQEYDQGTGRVCVGAGAGTGKTTILIEILSGIVLKEMESKSNPLDDVLVTTFNRDAASELKTRLKERLREHEEIADSELPPEIWRFIETSSHVETIDSFVHDLLNEIAIEAGVSPSFEVAEALETEDMVEEILQDIAEDEDYAESFERLRQAYSAEPWQRLPDDLRSFLFELYQKGREFCWRPEELSQELERSLTQDMHAGREPPFDASDIQSIVGELTADSISESDVDETLLDHVDSVYEYNRQLVNDVGRILEAFAEIYDHRSRAEGMLTYTDVTYIVWRYIVDNPDSALTESLDSRFDHILVDEFQDTNYAQCRILRELIRNENQQNNLFVIGDVKQSIYQWRSAAPSIFRSIIKHAKSESSTPDPFLNATNIEYHPLISNYRSHPHLVQAGNHIFSDIFTDIRRGDIGTFTVPYEELHARRNNTESSEPHIHVIDMGDLTSRQEWVDNEAERVAQTVSGILQHGEIHINRNAMDETPELDTANPNDITLLFRSRQHMSLFSEKLNEYGVKSTVVATEGLFQETEVELIIDVLDWFAHPHSKDSLIRILRSPITALSDKSLRYLASKRYDLSETVNDWPTELDPSDRDRLQALIRLRDDLRWDREGKKSNLIQKIIRHSAFDAVVLGEASALENYGNLWVFTELVNGWEEEELLPYREFVDRLKRLRERANEGNTGYPTAQIADENSKDTVRLMTVHASKGRQFPIVFLPDMLVRSSHQPHDQEFIADRDHGVALHPRLPPETGSFNLNTGPGSNWISDQGSGVIWISGSRTSGEITHPHPLNNHIRDNEAEFWRLLYVAFTRTADHIFLPLGEETPHGGAWNTWMVALRDALQETQGWDSGVYQFEATRDTVHDEDSPVIPVGVNDVAAGNVDEPAPLGLPDVEETDSGNKFNKLVDSFSPTTVTPTSLHDLLECPLRFQYRMLQGVSEIRADIPPGSDPPEGIHSSEWGRIVHSALEQWHRGEGEFSRFLDEASEGVRECIRGRVLPNYRESVTWEEVNGEGVDLFPELDLLGYLSFGGFELYVRGTVDLVYKRGESWRVVDFKTGRVPETGDYLYSNYRWQVSSYVWLLEELYDIEVEEARLVYVDPEFHEEEVEISLQDFEERLSDLSETIEAENEVGLPARPAPVPEDVDDGSPPVDSRCGTCPYQDLCPHW